MTLPAAMPWTEPRDVPDAAAAMMPGMAVQDAPIDAGEALLLVTLLGRLKRVRTDPGSGDRAFLQSIARQAPGSLTERQRAHIMRLAWRYRFQLPQWLRPGADPDKPTNSKAV